MRNTVKPIAIAAVSMIAATAHAQLPLTGDYACQMDFMHMMNSQAGLAMISGANCTLEGDDKNTVTFTNNVLFDEKGKGKLINSNGLTSIGGEPATAFVGIESTWILDMKDGQMVGYSANGVNDIVAGENEGKKIYWRATPTGPDTLTISYEVKD
jgi:hypothetical protein